MAQQSNTAALAVNIGHQRLDTARTDPTAPLYLGTVTDTDQPVTLARDEPFDPILLTGATGTGKTTLAHHIAYQQLHPNSGLCYVSAVGQPLAPSLPEHDSTTISPGTDRDPTTAVPDDLGSNAAVHEVLCDRRDQTTTLTNAIIEQVFQNRSTAATDHPYTLVIDGLGAFDLDQLALDTLLSESRPRGLHIIIATQLLTALPSWIERSLRGMTTTHLLGQSTQHEAEQLATYYPTVAADKLAALSRYQWVLHQPATDPEQTTQFTSPPPQRLRPDDH